MELRELTERLTKLQAFMESSGFISLSPEARHLLYSQEVVMQMYEQILQQRLMLMAS